MRAIPGCFKDEAHADGIWSVAWSKVDNTIVTGSVDDLVKTWKWYAHASAYCSITSHADCVSCFAHSDTSDDGVKLVHKQDLGGHQLGVVSVALSAAGNGSCACSLNSASGHGP